MSVDSKAYLLGNVDFEEINSFIKATIDPDAKLLLKSEQKCHGPYEEFKGQCIDPKGMWITKSAVIHFKDKCDMNRSAFLFFSTILDNDFLFKNPEYRKNGATIIILHCDSEGKRITYELVRRFGGWHVACDSNPEYIRVYKLHPTEEEILQENAWRIKLLKDSISNNLNSLLEAVKNYGKDLLFPEDISFVDEIKEWNLRIEKLLDTKIKK